MQSKFLVAFLYVVTMLFWFFCGCRGFCHWTESDIFLFLFGMFETSEKSFRPCGVIDVHLLPTSRSNLLPGGGP